MKKGKFASKNTLIEPGQKGIPVRVFDKDLGKNSDSSLNPLTQQLVEQANDQIQEQISEPQDQE